MAQPPPPIFTNPLQQTSTAIVIAPVNPSDYMSPSPFLVPAAAVQPRRNQSPSPADAKLQKRDKGSVGPRDAKRIPWLLTAWVTKEPKFDSREEKPRETGVAVARAAVSKSEVEVVKTIVVEPGPRCPYPYPHQSCGPAYTTVKTETQTRTVAGTKEKQCKTMCEDVKEEGKDGGGKKTEAKGKGSGLVTLTRTVAAIAVVQTVVASIIGDGERTA